MKIYLFTLLSILTFFTQAQTTFTYTGTGDWTDQGNWSPSYPGTTINAQDEVIISAGADVALIVVTINGTLTNNGTLESRSTFTNNGTIINEGLITNRSFFTNEGTITNNGQWNNSSIFINNSMLTNNGTFQNNAFLYGDNTTHTNDFNLSQLFSPGNSASPDVGTYVFDSNATFLSSANVTADIRSVSEVDLVQVASTATLSGTLNVNLLDSYDPVIGTTYTILTANSVNGTFNTINYPTLVGNKAFEISYTATSVILTVVRTPFVYTGTGDWTDQGNWSPSYPGTTINAQDEVIISAGADVALIVVTINGTLTNNGTLESRSTFTNNGTITNEGLITNRSFFTNEGNITNNGQWNNSSIFINNSMLTNNGTFQNNAFLYGDNTTHTNDFNLSQLFSPGNSASPDVGTYVFDSNATFLSSANVTTDIRSISEVDLVQVASTATLSGTLNVNLLDSYDPAIGTTYTILTANSISGTFNTINYPDLGVDKEFQITYNSNSVVVEVVDSHVLNVDDLDTTNQVKIIMYPNPTTNTLHIDGLHTSEKIAIYSMLGAKLLESVVSPSENKIMVNTLSKGSYFLSIGNANYRFAKN
ncbi:T9SS type A sorting domain-containing protein [Aquimarina sp. 2201CG5-10]|uniref:T9SS type A sorting domain-containing protein n=1 Tax=Aquimarina callyspongiae TaxID=3098150 RepID=UPI002AB58C45|nr:T9SS type A sorting domain-containing protein [Aquimarina sp. 2201CG5-10]MDY8136571.1 T9SS type A sorting domain-containing protein [Aquimarina sp. 2201CG5-10]